MNADDRDGSPPDYFWVSGPARILIKRLRALSPTIREPVFVGIDGRGGAGKSTLATAISNDFPSVGVDLGAVTVIESDQFYAGGSSEVWDQRTVAERAERVIDWRLQRAVLERLREEGAAAWHPFDWDSGDWDSDVVPHTAEPVIAHITPVVVLEGAYSCRPELHDMLDLRVLLDVPQELRRRPPRGGQHSRVRHHGHHISPSIKPRRGCGRDQGCVH